MRTQGRRSGSAHSPGEGRYLRFRWEDICASPEAVLARICTLSEIEPGALMARVNAETPHIIGHDARLKPVRPIRSDESWRTTLEPSQRLTAERQAGKLCHAFGYD